MKIDNTSMFFNSTIQDATATAAWGTSIGQSQRNGYKINTEIDGITDLLVGMTYKLKSDKENLDIREGSNTRELLMFSVFDKVFINNELIHDVKFILLLAKEHSKSHDGRIIISYPPYAKYKIGESLINNLHAIEKMKIQINCITGCWFVNDITIKNQDELHFNAIIVNENPVVYSTSNERSQTWELLIENNFNIKDDFKRYLLQVHKLKTEKTADDYINRQMPEVKKWFLENELCDENFQIWDINNDLTEINSLLNGSLKESWQAAAAKKNGDGGFMMASWNRWVEFINWRKEYNNQIPMIDFNINAFIDALTKTGLSFSKELVQRFIASLWTKPFVICSGLSGSGKTKLALSFVQWICKTDRQYKIIPVGADWTNREPLLGYPNGLDNENYVTPDSGALQLIIEASKEINKSKPYFMILDEMNLSHVERYFADFLSIMESEDSIKLYTGADRRDSNENFIEKEIIWPKNLFIIGTVNIDETTYMFSPKVLDRANVIEFRISSSEMSKFFNEEKNLDLKEIFLEREESKGGGGQNMGESFLNSALDKKIIKIPELEGDKNIFNRFFEELQIVGSEFGYRSAKEIELLITKLGNNRFFDIEGKLINNKNKIDIAIMQKLLPKLHGSRKKLAGPLETLAGFCLERINGSEVGEENKNKSKYQQFILEKKDISKWQINYKLSFEKIERMHKNLIENGFTSFAEA